MRVLWLPTWSACHARPRVPDPLGYALVDSEGWTVVEDDEDVQLLALPPGWMAQDG